MIRNLKIFGLSAMAALALAASAAPAAPAAEFHVSSSPTSLWGIQSNTHVLTTDPGTMTCETTALTSLMSTKTAHMIQMTMTYELCTLKTIFGNITVQVNFNGCKYYFNASGHTEINCPVGKEIIISGPGCSIRIPPQTITKGASYSNNAAKTDIVIHHGASGIKYSYTGFTCGSGTETTNGTFTGDTTFQNGTGGSLWHE